MAFGHFLAAPAAGEMWQVDRAVAGGIPPKDVPARTDALLAELVRVQTGFAGTISNRPIDVENQAIPAGYTYLLQFVAHDLVDSAAPIWSGDVGTARNRRTRRLLLDTLYGAGPQGAPALYVADATGASLGTKFAIGTLTADTERSLTWPQRDVARNPDPADPADTDTTVPCPVLGDARNDYNTIVSQLSLVFMHFHNAIVDRLAATPGRNGRKTADALRRFTLARDTVTLIFRRIVREELLPRILCADIAKYYANGGTCLDEAFAKDATAPLPVEFAHGAFRFGHAMLRQSYVFNNDSSIPNNGAPSLQDVLMQSSERKPTRGRLEASWAIAWARFFPIAGRSPTPLNLSHAIVPGSHGFLNGTAEERRFQSVDGHRPLFTPRTNKADEGLMMRDLLSSTTCEAWSVPKLVARARKRAAGRALIPAGSDTAEGLWAPAMTAYLTQRNMAPADVAAVVADPPWPFFVAFEAAWQTQGISLGRVGSIIVGDVLHAELSRAPYAVPAKANFSKLLSSLDPIVPELVAVTRGAPVASMADLILFVEHAYAPGQPTPHFAGA